MSTRWTLFSLCAILATLAPEAGALTGIAFYNTNGTVLLMSTCEEASFAKPLNSRNNTILYLSEPLDACRSLTNQEIRGQSYPIALIEKGGCQFDDKVRRAQEAGFKAAIVFDNEDQDTLVKMLGDPTGVEIPAVFVAKATGQELQRHTRCHVNMELFVIPVNDTAGLVRFCVLAAIIVLFLRLLRVKAQSSETFTSAADDKPTSLTCFICRDDYAAGDQLTVFPCGHRYHTQCADKWQSGASWFSSGSCQFCKRGLLRPMETDEASPRNHHPRENQDWNGYWNCTAKDQLREPASSRELYS